MQSTPPSSPRRRYWLAVRRLTGGLLLAWMLLSFGAPWFASGIDRWTPGGFPISYWMAAQGALLLFIAIVVIYAWQMDRIDDRFHAEGRRDPDSTYTADAADEEP